MCVLKRRDLTSECPAFKLGGQIPYKNDPFLVSHLQIGSGLPGKIKALFSFKLNEAKKKLHRFVRCILPPFLPPSPYFCLWHER